MPTISLTLEDVDQTIVRQSLLNIVREVAKVTNISESSMVILHGDIKYSLTDNKINMGVNKSPVSNIPDVASNRKLYIEISDNFNEDALTTTAVDQQEYYPIYMDEDIKCYAWPVYVQTDYVVSFTHIVPSKTEAIRWRDDVRMRLSKTRDILVHDVQYDILLPDVLEDFITDVYTLKNRLNPQSLEDYFRSNTTKRIKIMTDISGGNAKLAVTERQVRIVGLFDFTPMPEKAERSDDANNYTITFNYKLTLDRPAMIAIKYEPMICNKLLPNKWLSFITDSITKKKEEENKLLGYSRSLNALSYFEAHRQLDKKINVKLPINIPEFDKFNIRTILKGYAITTTLLSDIDETNKTFIFNLRDLSPYYINSELLDWIAVNARTQTVSPYQSFLYLGLYQEGKYFDAPILTIDADLNVSSDTPLNLNNVTRIMLNVLIDVSYLSDAYWLWLIGFPNIFQMFISEWLLQSINFKEIVNKMSMLDILKFLQGLLSRLQNVGNNINTIKFLTTIKEINPSLYNNLLIFIKNNFPILTSNLITTKVISKTDIPIGTNFIDIYRNIPGKMRTVQKSYIVTERNN